MLIGYGNYQLSFSSIGSSPGGATNLTDPAALFDGQSGSGTSFRWGGGTQNTSSYIQITFSVSSPMDATAPLGVAGLINVQGLPAGTLVRIGTTLANSVAQRLTVGFRGELGAWVIPTTAIAGNAVSIWIYNDVNGVASIAPSATFAIGEIFVGRLTSIPTLRNPAPGEGMTDPTAWVANDGLQFHPTMRKAVRVVSGTLGKFSLIDAHIGGTLGMIKSGGNPNGKISVRNLSAMLATSSVCAVCNFPHDDVSTHSKSADGYLFDAEAIQQTMMLARPTQLGDVLMTDDPLFTQQVRYGEAT